MCPSNGVDYGDEFVAEDFIAYNNFLRTSIFYSIARKHITLKSKMLTHNSVS